VKIKQPLFLKRDRELLLLFKITYCKIGNVSTNGKNRIEIEKKK
jgi:hypothetical protein